MGYKNHSVEAGVKYDLGFPTTYLKNIQSRGFQNNISYTLMTEYGNRGINSWYNESIEKNYQSVSRVTLAVGGVITVITIASPVLTGMFGGGVAANSSIGNVALSQFSGVVTSVSALFTTIFFKHNQDTQNKEKTYKKKEDEDKKQ